MDGSSDPDLREFLQEVAAGRRAFEEPGEGFDPERASERELALRGLPPPPLRDDAAYELWLVIVRSLQQGSVEPSFAAGDPRTGYNRLGLKGHLSTSRNWSGGVLAAPHRRTPFQHLLGTWVVPRFRTPSGGTRDEYACSTWVGFDGFRRISRSLPQMGTLQKITKGQKDVMAWWQWWSKEKTTPGPRNYTGFHVAEGETVVASLFVIPSIGVLFNLANRTTLRRTVPVFSPPPKSFPDISALDADCILERPKQMPQNNNQDPPNYVVPAFDDTTFRCYARLSGASHFRTMKGARIVRMVHSVPTGGIETIATPFRYDGRNGDIGVRYRGA